VCSPLHFLVLYQQLLANCSADASNSTCRNWRCSSAQHPEVLYSKSSRSPQERERILYLKSSVVVWCVVSKLRGGSFSTMSFSIHYPPWTSNTEFSPSQSLPHQSIRPIRLGPRHPTILLAPVSCSIFISFVILRFILALFFWGRFLVSQVQSECSSGLQEFFQMSCQQVDYDLCDIFLFT
jgi:hypothetical protein